MNKILYVIVMTVTLYSCSNTVGDKGSEGKESTIPIEHEHGNDEVIVLNNGEKWKVDENMMAHIRNMENNITVFKTSEDRNYSVLASLLERNIELLTSNCTMEGQAHDELHKWLIPYIETVNTFSESTNDNVAAEQLEYIEKYFVTFNQYFE